MNGILSDFNKAVNSRAPLSMTLHSLTFAIVACCCICSTNTGSGPNSAAETGSETPPFALKTVAENSAGLPEEAMPRGGLVVAFCFVNSCWRCSCLVEWGELDAAADLEEVDGLGLMRLQLGVVGILVEI
jgi:hypothetical protein